MVECGGLENRCSPSGEPGVRIPLSPQSLNKPRDSGVIYFTEVPKKACFLKDLRENKYNPKGLFKLCRVPPQGSRPNEVRS